MKDKYQAEAYIGQRYGYTNYCAAEDALVLAFDARYVAVLVPKKIWNSGPSYRVHEVKDGKLGQQIDSIPFAEVRHVGA